jgi:Glu-tRNA(Gln) amidotransferase subunit E-like FAD-binding protein
MADQLLKTFQVTAHWDPEAEVFYSETDVPGLVVETETLDEFIELVNHFTPELLADNMPEFKGPYRLTIEARREFLKAVA